jgi:hypothetical protein
MIRAERVLNLSILYTHYIVGGVNEFRFGILGAKFWAKKCHLTCHKFTEIFVKFFSLEKK